MKEKEMCILYNYINSKKSVFATMVLRMMDMDYSYEQALDLICRIFTEINVAELEKELDLYI